MSRTSRTLTNTDLAFLLCTTAATAPQTNGNFSRRSFRLSFETDYGLMLSLEPDNSITITLSKPQDHEYSDPFNNTTPIKSQQFRPPVSVPTHSHGRSIDGVLLSSPVSLNFMGTETGMGGATITAARPRGPPPSTHIPPPPPSTVTPTLTRTSSQRHIQTQSQSSAIPKKIQYYIRPSLDAKSSTHIDTTTTTTTTTTTSNPKPRQLHRVKESHLQSLYHHPPSSSASSSSSSSAPASASSYTNSTNSWFDSYLDWTDRLEDACAASAAQQPATSSTFSKTQTRESQQGPFTDEGEKSLWLVEGLLLASWLSLQEGVEAVEYVPFPSSEVYRLEQHGNNAGVAMRRLLERIGVGE
ncbi:hypothetical protein NEUTE2DRAFT_159411 [Neurospora tetrasperma FGSC 2509]|nr:hypothetical protein NEUTE2DRAFT_159411 [Neurospora tetrasperma FGSC 2509]